MGCSSSKPEMEPVPPPEPPPPPPRPDIALGDKTICNFAHLKLKDEDVLKIATELATNKTVTKMHLNSMSQTITSTALAYNRYAPPHVCYPHTGNWFQEEASEALGVALHTNNTLQVLNLKSVCTHTETSNHLLASLAHTTPAPRHGWMYANTCTRSLL